MYAIVFVEKLRHQTVPLKHSRNIYFCHACADMHDYKIKTTDYFLYLSLQAEVKQFFFIFIVFLLYGICLV